MRPRFQSCSIPIVLWAIGLSGSTQAQVLLPEQVKAAVREDWDILVSSVETATWESVVEAKSAKDSTQPQLFRIDRSRFVFRQNHGVLFSNEYEMFGTQVSKKAAIKRLDISNPHYAAELEPTANDGESWLLKKYVGLTQCNWVCRRVDDSKTKTQRITKARKHEKEPQDCGFFRAFVLSCFRDRFWISA